MPRLAREMPGEMQLGQVRHGVAVAQAVHAEPDQRADIEREAVLLRTIEADGRPRIGPGAIEQRQRAMVEDVGEALEGRVAMVAPPVAGVFRQMQRQRRRPGRTGRRNAPAAAPPVIRASVAPVRNAASVAGANTTEGSCASRTASCAGRTLSAEARPVAILRLEPPHRLIEAVLPRRRPRAAPAAVVGDGLELG